MESTDLTQKNIETIAKLFPNVVIKIKRFAKLFLDIMKLSCYAI